MNIACQKAPKALRSIHAVGEYNPLMKGKPGETLFLSERIKWFKLKYPNGRIELSAVSMEFPAVIFHAKVHADGKELASASGSCLLERGDVPSGEMVATAVRQAENTALKLAGFQLWGEPLHENWS